MGLQGWSLAGLPAALWVERHEPDVAAATRWYLATWDFLALRLTGRAATSLVEGQPFPQPSVLDAAGIPARRVPERGSRRRGRRGAHPGGRGPAGTRTLDPGRRWHGRCLGELQRCRDDRQGRRDRCRRCRGRLRRLLGRADPRGGLVRDDRATPGAVQRRRRDGRDRPGDRLVPDRGRPRRRLDGGAHRGGGGHPARRRRRALPAVSRRRTLADLGPDGAGRVRRPDARSPARAPRAGDPRGVGSGHPPRRGADPRCRDPGRRNAGLRRSRSERDLEPDQGRRHRVHRRGAVGAGDRGRRGGDSRGHGDRRVSRCAGGDPRHDPGRPPPGAESQQPRPLRRGVRCLRPAASRDLADPRGARPPARG